MGSMISRKQRELTDTDIAKISDTYHNWRNIDGDYEDKQGFCKSAAIKDIAALNYVLTPGRYIGLPDDEDDFNFEERVTKLKEELLAQMDEEIKLNEVIKENLKKIKMA